MTKEGRSEVVHLGRHLAMFDRDGWEFVSRNTKRPAVGIVAVTNEARVILVEQFRPALDRRVFELPAGLAGDIAGAEDEDLVDAARRELMEETGFASSRWTELGRGFTSPGLTDESIMLFLAEGLSKQGPGGGDESEDITVHEVPFENVVTWLHDRRAAADLKLLAALYLAQQVIQRRTRR